jgi:hypothetical protein
MSVLLFVSCGINQQVDQLKALEKCKYQIASADSIYLANTDISKLISDKRFNLAAAPGLAFALLQQNVPFKARLNLQIINSGNNIAGINEFDYKVLIKDHEITSGRINQKITIEPKGGITTVPVKINSNIYPLLANSQNRKALADFLSSDSIKTAIITFKIKPTLALGGQKIEYPGFINIDKEITNKTLLSYINDIH